ncbi:glycine zipper 2TM domain-containing protein [Sphingomonas sp. AOB5]|uniref:glycine zipper 2TM domain-containing protein n=1 Tax=Sphingomonas sp. AOB5 TaxID=3034017 RepID=UPI0023F69C63|nr:glycine zipper 2TM domain-containing protein [Sphingomonas sp. AOB5]MDF7777220.1 glycine zipper 2TM domain-containing protein [Sphingomonas sp. AOB5]
MKKFLIGLSALAVAIPAMPSAAVAQNYRNDSRYERDYRDDYRQDYRQDRRDDRRQDRRYARYYNNQGYYSGPTWRGRNGENYCRRSDGSTGLLIGAVGGALVGRTIDTRGDRTAGTLLGAVIGGLIGNSIEKDNNRNSYRCR